MTKMGAVCILVEQILLYGVIDIVHYRTASCPLRSTVIYPISSSPHDASRSKSESRDMGIADIV